MDYSKLKKDELLQIVTKQQTLASVVDAKNKEIRELKEKIEQLLKLEKESKTIKQELKNAEQQRDYNKKMLEEKDALIAQQALQIKQERDVDEIVKQNEQLIKDTNRAYTVVNQYINAFRNYLKVQQGALDNVLEMEALLTKQIQTEEVS